jgi:hypothetical protein
MMTQPKRTAQLAPTRKAPKDADSRVKDSARWLFQFAKIDLTNLTEKQSIKLAVELAVVGKREASDILPGIRFDPFVQFLTLDHRGQMGIMGAFQGWLQEQFKQAHVGPGWALDPLLTPFRIIDLFKTHNKNLRADSFVVWSIADCFKAAANRIVDREADRFGICQNPRCGKTFVAERKNRGKYCKLACASYVNVMKSRGKL